MNWSEKFKSKQFWKEVGGTGLDIVIVVALALIIKTYLFAPFQVHGQSMCNTLNVDGQSECHTDNYEYIVVSKISYLLGQPARGDIVVLEPPNNSQNYYIKRIIGLPGDKIKIDNHDVYIYSATAGKYVALEENYLRCKSSINGKVVNECNYSLAAQKEYVVPPNSYFVMGDNRNNSSDSRSCFGDGCNLPTSTPYVTRSEIVGKTVLVWWPLGNMRLVPSYQYQGL